MSLWLLFEAHFRGRLDEVQVYPRAMVASEAFWPDESKVAGVE